MTLEIVFHEEAEVEYRISYIWYEERSKGLGVRFRQAVNQVIEKIKRNPEIYGETKKGFREASIARFPFIIVYCILKERQVIFISSVFHTKRIPQSKYRKI